MFQGATPLTLDAKGRMAIPARHRELLNGEAQGKLVLTAHPRGCLLLFPGPVWVDFRERVLNVSEIDKVTEGIRFVMIGMAEPLTPDAQGRILILPPLREFAGLEKQLMMVGQGTHFQIWGEAAWKRQVDEAKAAFAQRTHSTRGDLTF